MKETAHLEPVGAGRSVSAESGRDKMPGPSRVAEGKLKPGATTPLFRGLLHLRLERSSDTRLRFFQMRFGGGVSDLADRERLFDLPLNAQQARASERGGILGRARRGWNGQDEPDRWGAGHGRSGALHQADQLLEVLALEVTAQTADSSRGGVQLRPDGGVQPVEQVGHQEGLLARCEAQFVVENAVEQHGMEQAVQDIALQGEHRILPGQVNALRPEARGEEVKTLEPFDGQSVEQAGRQLEGLFAEGVSAKEFQGLALFGRRHNGVGRTAMGIADVVADVVNAADIFRGSEQGAVVLADGAADASAKDLVPFAGSGDFTFHRAPKLVDDPDYLAEIGQAV